MIEVIQAGYVERCQVRNVDGLQCDHFAEHFGSHQHAVSSAECLRWPSQDDIEDAAHSARVEAMTDEEVEASLLDEEAGVDRDMIKNWSLGVGVFAKAMIKAKTEIERMRPVYEAAIALRDVSHARGSAGVSASAHKRAKLALLAAVDAAQRKETP